MRYREGLNACINCGICTSVCPAAEVSDYDPRMVVDTVSAKNESLLLELLKSDTIWRCGECLSCKTRCPRGNVPCYIIQSLRLFPLRQDSLQECRGPKATGGQANVGDHILKYGYCVYIDESGTNGTRSRDRCGVAQGKQGEHPLPVWYQLPTDQGRHSKEHREGVARRPAENFR